MEGKNIMSELPRHATRIYSAERSRERMADRRSLGCNVEFKKMRKHNVGSKILV
jgi:hypothetical protein